MRDKKRDRPATPDMHRETRPPPDLGGGQQPVEDTNRGATTDGPAPERNGTKPPDEENKPSAAGVGTSPMVPADTNKPVCPSDPTAVGDDGASPITGGVAKKPQEGGEKAYGPLDPENLRLSQDFRSMGGVKKHLMTVPARKPTKEEWVRVHSDPAYRLETLILELKDRREMYVIDRSLWADLADESTVSPRVLYTAVNRQGTLFLWPVRLPRADGSIDSWNESLGEAVQMATTEWVRIQANMSLGGYDVFTAVGELSAPQWPDLSFRQILNVAFKNAIIDTLDHPVLRQLRGEV